MKRLKQIYKDEIIAKMISKFGYKNQLAVPKILKVCINIGVGKDKDDAKIISSLKEDLAKISAQLPVLRKAKKSIAGFKLRQGDTVGLKVTLRGQRMYNFLEKLIHVVLPRIRDFRGLDGKKFDSCGNYTFGIREQIVFPEIDYDKVVKVQPLQITTVTSAPTKDEAKELLKLIGFPFKK